jgi:hypothetical protein
MTKPRTKVQELNLSPHMIEMLTYAPPEDVLPRGGTRAALIRRGLVVDGNSSRFGRLTEAGYELALELRREP